MVEEIGNVEMGGLAVEEASRAEGESGGRGHVDMGALAAEEMWRTSEERRVGKEGRSRGAPDH